MHNTEIKLLIDTLVSNHIVPDFKEVRKNVFDVIEKHFEGSMSITWDIQDIRTKAEELGHELDEQQCNNVLRRIEETNAYFRVNWDAIDASIESEIS